MKCSLCEGELKDGDTAYVKVERKIVVKGDMVTTTDTEILVCSWCS